MAKAPPKKHKGKKAAPSKAAIPVPSARKKKPLTEKQKAALAKGRARKGEPSRNPHGPPKKPHTIIMQARDIVDGPHPMPKVPKDATVAYMIARMWVVQAMGGDKDARKELNDRLYGRVKDEVVFEQKKVYSDSEAVQRVQALEDERKRLLGIIEEPPGG